MQVLSADVVIVGAGSAGISVAARLRRLEPDLKITIIEPKQQHFYQPLWTLVAAGAVCKEKTVRPQIRIIPDGCQWVQDSAVEFQPEKSHVITQNGTIVTYRYLVLAPGLQLDWNKIEGAEDALGSYGVFSVYQFNLLDYAWDTIRTFSGGPAIFTFPSTPVKCAGAAQKIMYLADDNFIKNRVKDKTSVQFISGGASIFGVKKYADSLTKIIDRRGISTKFKWNLRAVKTPEKIATFESTSNFAESIDVPFDLLHIVPPMSAPDFIKKSCFSDSSGWVDVDKKTLQHVRYKNVFSLGDASSLPTSRTGAAVRHQAPIVVQNLLAQMQDKPLLAEYDGYTSCPLITGYGKLILAEFDYNGNPKETFPFDQSKERLSMYLLKKYGLPLLYWNGMLKGLV